LRFTLVLSALHTATLLGVWAVFRLLFQRGIARTKQVRGGRAPDAQLAANAARELIMGQLLFAVICYALVYPLWRGQGGRMDAGFASPVRLALELGAFILIEDTIFYWSHRLLHTRWLFRHVHARHHRFRYVRVPSAEYAHPLENAINFVALFAGPLLLGSAFSTLAIWMVLRMTETTEAHSGYALSPVSDRHAFHHLYAQRGCYGSFVSPWDTLMRTDREFRAWRAAGRP